MPQKLRKKETSDTIDYVIAGILKKKGKEVLRLDMMKLPNSIAKYFVICHGTSKPHVEAIADSVQECVKKNTGTNVWNKEGFENAEWILIDYGDIVVHVFQEISRRHYKLEDLWADAEIQRFGSDD
ncbi:MAG: ribosome silencing factor [Bacteroidetes bacterium]|nr:ribosome silencing factor [Bacteroidota bacterium]